MVRDNVSAKGAGMLAKLQTFSLAGIEAVPVEVEVDVSPGALSKTVLVEDIEVILVASLAQAVGFFANGLEVDPTPSQLD
jgi:magnesium chelatase family protein